ncbi:hypothetical protein [Clostridium septicum]|uniref:Dockerin domain-containing protein n=1 Tax=Clostridium septicum TaxID=1504 RepID=A0A9N7JLP6_CLOSE|nr:hypothetical protein [Clostridium septicum]AYE34269.1 hypothetical protein CP523_07300 [Clostridium septicum]QAS59675.1 hypothetical protein EI377_02050 [Clostridium septicum]UEC21094.1 hypothetical protein LK444_01455 [Clostridium septicum]USS00857.1 hypothetical protein NH397_15640 [Clostridium septicum]
MRKIKKSYIALFLGIILILNPSIVSYSFDNKEVKNVDTKQDNQLKDVVYLTGGQGPTFQGDGTLSNPYQNIKTALDNVKQGGTIKITGKFRYWKYEETPSLLNRPLIIDKEVTIVGAEGNNEFLVRAPIQLGANVTFANLNMQFWASNELMPGVPDSGLPQTPVDEGTQFRSGRTIYLAGYKLTLDNINTCINVISYQREYRPYISGGTFIEGGQTGPKAVLEVKNLNSGTEFAGIYAGDYWVQRNYPVELNVKGRVLDKTIHSGGIMVPSKSDVVINLGNKTRVNTINTEKHDANVDVNIKGGGGMTNATLNGIRNLTIESGEIVELKKDSKFEVENITLKSNSLLDLRKINGNAKINGNFIGETNSSIDAGSIYLDNGKILEVGGDVEGTTILNKFRLEVIPVKENATYIRAKANATGDFVIKPNYQQSHYKLVKNINDGSYTTWNVTRNDISNKDIFKEIRWTNEDNVILKPSSSEDYIFYYEFINDKDEVYVPVVDDWKDISVTLTRKNGTVLNLDDNFDEDMSMGTYVDHDKPYVLLQFSPQFINKNMPEELTLKINHKDEKAISRKIYVGEKKPTTTILDLATAASKYNLQKGQDGYEDIYDLNNDGIIDIFDIVAISKSMTN